MKASIGGGAHQIAWRTSPSLLKEVGHVSLLGDEVSLIGPASEMPGNSSALEGGNGRRDVDRSLLLRNAFQALRPPILWHA